MAVLLGAVGAAFELLVRMSGSPYFRAGAAVALLAAFLLVWINAAVGIIGSERNPPNLMYGAVIAIAVSGAAIARLRAGGIARALVAACAAQLTVGAIAIGARLGLNGAIWPRDVLVLSAGFACLWLFSAWLFAKAAREERRAGRGAPG
jgi:hypothetical protein